MKLHRFLENITDNIYYDNNNNDAVTRTSKLFCVSLQQFYLCLLQDLAAVQTYCVDRSPV